MRHVFLQALAIWLALPVFSALAAQDSLINLPRARESAAPDAPAATMPESPAALAPGRVIFLPDGRRAVIEEYLPNGALRTNLGQVLSPEGIVLEGQGKGQAVSLEPMVQLETPRAVAPDTPESVIRQPENRRESAPAPKQKGAEPDNAISQEGQKTPKSVEPEQELTLAQLLPMTPIETREKKPEQKKEDVKEKKTEARAAPKAGPGTGEKARQPAHEKTGIGQELRIPPEAAASGNLDFLEGCWQGIRPEYFSKRTIRECFCFGANGGGGKRRVYDPSGGRMCIGSTRARLSRDGVLSVTSEGAACNDGERWGAAEMVCRNSGPKTPCSWIFRDANNGRQAYEIPFTRVESCGR